MIILSGLWGFLVEDKTELNIAPYNKYILQGKNR